METVQPAVLHEEVEIEMPVAHAVLNINTPNSDLYGGGTSSDVVAVAEVYTGRV